MVGRLRIVFLCCQGPDQGDFLVAHDAQLAFSIHFGEIRMGPWKFEC
jgi:hypothetical protein